MGGKPCIRGTRVTVSVVLSLLSEGVTQDQILADYLYLTVEDIVAALSFAAWRALECDLPLANDEDHRGHVPLAQVG